MKKNNFPEIFRKFSRHFEIILLKLLKNFSEIFGRFQTFLWKFWKNYRVELILKKFGRPVRKLRKLRRNLMKSFKKFGNF